MLIFFKTSYLNFKIAKLINIVTNPFNIWKIIKNRENKKKVGLTLNKFRNSINSNVILDLLVKVGSRIKSARGTSDKTDNDIIPISRISKNEIILK